MAQLLPDRSMATRNLRIPVSSLLICRLNSLGGVASGLCLSGLMASQD